MIKCFGLLGAHRGDQIINFFFFTDSFFGDNHASSLQHLLLLYRLYSSSCTVETNKNKDKEHNKAEYFEEAFFALAFNFYNLICML